MSSKQQSAEATPISGKDRSIQGDSAPIQANKIWKEKPLIYVLDRSRWPTPTEFRQMHKPLLDTLELIATVKFARNGDQARSALALKPHAVLLAHHECVPDSGEPMNDTLFNYMCGGGILILTGNCVASTKYVDLNRFLRHFEVDWTIGDNTWTVCDTFLNDTFETLKYDYLENEIEGIDANYVSVRNRNDAWYIAADSGDALIAVGKVGDGRLGFIGDKFSRPATYAAVLAMCGLPGLAKLDRTEWGDEDRTEVEMSLRELIVDSLLNPGRTVE
ncbi:hypothetical protein IQ07DRAFT_681103 [Pyrenochaeta sp. DS3sAY3a]|nr:hypothetical protein IQ07DRAFT_681103 [Pyrenochaeta sp. DS3sAY3a]